MIILIIITVYHHHHHQRNDDDVDDGMPLNATGKKENCRLNITITCRKLDWPKLILK